MAAMKHTLPRALTLLCTLAVAWHATAAPWGTWDEATQRFADADQADHVTVTTLGQSVEGRPLFVVRIHPADDADPTAITTALLIGLQHGDEPAGGRALLELIADLAADRSLIPASVDLHIVAILNPDGAIKDQRRNANGFDLNRDHALLSQPETQALHAYAHRLRPDLVVDCHEFNRTTSDYTDRGWSEWPIITLDYANSPYLPPAAVRAGHATLDAVTPAMLDAGVHFTRYLVGDAPLTPGGELRPSTLDADDCRNGLGLHAGCSFIIESGVPRAHDHPHADLPDRVAAYRRLIDALLADPKSRRHYCRANQIADDTALPDTLPVDFLWGRTDADRTPVNVVDLATGDTRAVPTPNVMDTRVVKRAVPTPLGYAIPAGPGDHAAAAVTAYRDLLDRHHLPAETLDTPTAFSAQPVELIALEDGYDDRYHRYAGRQITRLGNPAGTTLPAGSIVVRLDALTPRDARRAAALLEPAKTFGLYQWPTFQSLVTPDGLLPVVRLLDPIDE
jgi:hypothetical protein